MKVATHLPIPAVMSLKKLGRDIKDARKRRRVTVLLMAQRAGVSRATINKVENGDPTASMGAYTAVLFALGMLERLKDLADGSHDVTGRQLADEKLPQRIRMPRQPKAGNRHD